MTTHGHGSASASLRLTPAEYRDLAETIALTSQLFLLDAVWTSEATGASASSGAERSRRLHDLGPVVDEVEASLGKMADLVPRLESIFGRNEQAIQEAFNGLLTSKSRGFRTLTDEEHSQLQRVGDHVNNDFAGTVVSRTSGARSRIEDERLGIREEFGRLAGGYPSKGDFSAQTEQDLLWIGAGASVFFGPEALAVVEGAAHLVELGISIFHSIFG